MAINPGRGVSDACGGVAGGGAEVGAMGEKSAIEWTVADLIEEVRGRWFGCDDDTWVALGLAGEAGELCNLIKKENRITAPSPRYLQAQVAEELVDILFYVAKFIDVRDIDIKAAWDAKMAVNDEEYGRLKHMGDRSQIKWTDASLDRLPEVKLDGREWDEYPA